MGTNRFRLFILTCFLYGASGIFAADYPDGIAVNPLSPTDIPTDRKMIKLFSVNQSNLFTGEYLFEIPIDLPPAKGELVPKVALKYNSGERHTSIGFGWELECSYIHRSTRYGLPRYSSLADGTSSQDTIEYKISGSSGELIFTGSTPYGYLYRPKIDDSFMKFYYKPSIQEWKVYEMNGKVWIFGNNTLPGTPSLDADPQNPSRVFAWYVKRVSDTDDNMTEYYYAQYYGQLRLTEIRYDLNGSNVPPKVTFEYDYTANLIGSPPEGQLYIADWPHVSYQKGYRTVYGDEGLSRIVVYGWDEKNPQNFMTREYTPEYKPIKKYAGPFMGSYIMGLANIVSFEPEASVAGKPMPKTEFYYTEPVRSFYEEHVMADTYPGEMYFDQRSLFTSQIEYAALNGYFTTQVRIINMLMDVDGDGDKDILCVRSPKDYSGETLKWYWRENINGFSFSANYMEIIIPADMLNPHALEYQIDTQQAEASSPVGFINVIVTHQGIYDMNGDGAVDLVWQNRVGNDLKLYVCLGGYNDVQGKRQFGQSSVWLTSPGTVSFLKRTEIRRDGGTREYIWDTHDLFDINNDRLPDIVEVTSWDNYTKTLMGVSRNTQTGFPAMHDYELIYGIGDEISLSTGLSHYPAVIRSRVTEAEKASCVMRDLIDLNGDGLLDMVENNPVALTYKTTGAGIWWYFYASTEQSFHFAPGTYSGFDFDNQIYFPNLLNEPVWTTMEGVYGGHYGEVRSPTDGYFFDMNGDGIADYVQWTGSSSFDVRINTGRQLLDKMNWNWCTLGCSPFPSYPNPPIKNGPVDGITASIKFPITGNDGINPAGGYALTQNLDDLNGDGQLEFISIAWRNPNGTFRSTNTPWNIYRAWPTEANPSSSMILVTSENGSSTEINYKLADGYDWGSTYNVIPFPKWYVSLLRQNDSIEGKVQQSNIYSFEGKYDPVFREFRGFGRVEVVDSEKKVMHYYLQGEFDKSIEYRKEIRELAAPNTLRHLMEVTHDTVSYDSGKRRWVRPTVLDAITYDSCRNCTFETREDYQYLDFADYGLTQNVIYNIGDPEERRDNFEYYYLDDIASEKYLLRLKKKIRRDAALNTLKEETLYYDEMDDCDGTCETLVKGKLCKKVITRGPGLDPSVTRYEYDALGRITETLSPDQIRSVIQYWNDTPCISSTFYAIGSQPPYQMWHTIYYSDYHGLTGKAGKVCGPQYINNPAEDKCDSVIFDKYGRPLSLSRSLYHEDGRPYEEQTLNQDQIKQHGFQTIVTSSGKLQVHMAVYSGDVDLYLRNGAPPDLYTFDCRSYRGGTLDESCEVQGPGNIYVAAHVYSGNPSGTGTYGLYITKREKDDTLGGNLSVGEWHHYGPFDHAGYDSFRVNMYQISGDSDVYVRFGSEPSPTEYDCRPFMTTDEFCEISDKSGPFYVSVNGWTSSSYTLEIEWTQAVQSFEKHTVEAVSYFDRRNGSTPPYMTSILWPQYYYSAEGEKVDLNVFSGFAHFWLENEGGDLLADFNEDGIVDTSDLVMMSNSWMRNDVKMMTLGGYISHNQVLPPRETYTYFNASGRPILEQQFADSVYRKTYFEYDEFERLETANKPIFSPVYGYDKTAETFDGAYHTDYDVLGRITQITNPQGGRILQVFKGPQVELFDEIDNKTVYVKNKYNEIISKTQTADLVDMTSTFVYDGASHVIEATDPDGGVYRYTYNMDGTLSESQTPSQHWFYTYTTEGRISSTLKGSPESAAINYSYDLIGRLSLREELPGPGDTSIGPPRIYAFSYDGSTPFIGRLTRIESEEYIEDNLKYNENGELIYRHLFDKETGDGLFFRKIYSSSGDLIQEYFPEHKVSYNYNKLGQVSVLHAQAGVSARLDVNSVTYKANEKVDTVSGTFSNGSGSLAFSRAFTYDPTDQVTHVQTQINAFLWCLDYTYLPNGLISAEYDSGLRNFSHFFTYDTADRLTLAQGYLNLPDGSVNNGGAFWFEYNKNSSLSLVKWNTGLTQRNYVYEDATKHRLLGISGLGSHYEYNTNGQRIFQVTAGAETTYTWTPGGSLDSATIDQNQSLYEYTDKGYRWKAARGDGITYYLDDLELIKNAQRYHRLNIELPGGIRCALNKGGFAPDTCSFTDIHDNVVAVYNAAGSPLDISEYMPYGEKRLILGDDQYSEFDFAGRIKEEATGLLYYGKRYYDPLARQWISPDPLRITGIGDITTGINTLQPYIYAASDPITKMDPDGSEPDYAGTAGKMVLKSASGSSFNPGRDAAKYAGQQVGGPVGKGVEAAVNAMSFKGAYNRMVGNEEIKGLGKLIVKGAEKAAPNIGKQIGNVIVRGAAGSYAAVSGIGTVSAVGSLMYGNLASGSLPKHIQYQMKYAQQMNLLINAIATRLAIAKGVCMHNYVFENQTDNWKEAEQFCQGNINGGSGAGGDKETTSGEAEQQERQDNGDYNQTTGSKSSSENSPSSESGSTRQYQENQEESEGGGK